MKISECVERVNANELLVTGRVAVGFGLGRTYAPRYDRVAIVPTDEFNRLATSNRPTGYHTIGHNAGAPTDGLSEYRGESGIRYLVDATGAGRQYIYADAATVPGRVADDGWYVIWPDGGDWEAIEIYDGRLAGHLQACDSQTHRTAHDRFAGVCHAIESGHTDPDVGEEDAITIVRAWNGEAEPILCTVERVLLDSK